MVAGRRLAREPLDDQIGPQAAQHLDEKVDVLADLPEAEATGVGVVSAAIVVPRKSCS